MIVCQWLLLRADGYVWSGLVYVDWECTAVGIKNSKGRKEGGRKVRHKVTLCMGCITCYPLMAKDGAKIWEGGRGEGGQHIFHGFHPGQLRGTQHVICTQHYPQYGI